MTILIKMTISTEKWQFRFKMPILIQKCQFWHKNANLDTKNDNFDTKWQFCQIMTNLTENDNFGSKMTILTQKWQFWLKNDNFD